MSNSVRQLVKERYGQAALRVVQRQEKASCCGTGASCGAVDPITRDLYDSVTAASLPEKAVLASLGCGNPTALAELKEGEVVLDLGSGGGIDVLLSAKRVGASGKAYGLDMTDEMLELARKNAAEVGATNVEFLKGHIEEIPLPDNSVDVVISNCVINLSADKRSAVREAFRVLKPGGRFAVSDVVVTGEVPAEVRRSMELWVGCVAGALEVSEFERLLTEAGFENPSIEPTRVYEVEDARSLLEQAGLDVSGFAEAVKGRIMAAFVRATKPTDAVLLRRARPEDLAPVLTLLESAGLPQGEVREGFDRFVVAEYEGTIVGVAGLEVHGTDGILRSVVVSADWRGRGLGGSLTQAILSRAAEEGITAIYLLTETAEEFFPRYGFRRIAREKASEAVRASAEFRDLCPASAAVMVLHQPATG